MDETKEYRNYPVETKNPNVPDKSFLLAEAETNLGVDTYYIDHRGFIWHVQGGDGETPKHVPLFRACRVTGDTENMIHYRWLSYLRETKNSVEV